MKIYVGFLSFYLYWLMVAAFLQMPDGLILILAGIQTLATATLIKINYAN